MTGCWEPAVAFSRLKLGDHTNTININYCKTSERTPSTGTWYIWITSSQFLCWATSHRRAVISILRQMSMSTFMAFSWILLSSSDKFYKGNKQKQENLPMKLSDIKGWHHFLIHQYNMEEENTLSLHYVAKKYHSGFKKNKTWLITYLWNISRW